MKSLNKIELDMTVMDVIVVMSDGNLGALNVLMEIMEHGHEIDPQAGHVVLTLGLLDSWGIYGTLIWQLYKDICGESIANMLAVIRHCQLGMSREEDLFKQKDMARIMAEVQAELPEFNRKEDNNE